MKGEFYMKFVYVVFEYMPKHKSHGWIFEGGYLWAFPKIFESYKDARAHMKKYRHASFVKKVKLR